MPKTESHTPIPFTHNPLNRHGDMRQKQDWIAQQLEADHALFVPFWQDKPLVLPPLQAGDGRDTGWLTRAQLQRFLQEISPIFLGINRNNKPLFTFALRKPADATALQELGKFEDLRELAMIGDLPPAELGILAQAKALMHWHQTHRFCACCGQATHMREGGYKRRCEQCKAEHFPRTDPVVIMLATYKDACLVGRQKGWPDNMFSALAGFVEPGETLEAAVIRELEEEAGIAAYDVRYVASQPWPFPASLMIGCLAQSKGDKITPDGHELEAAHWVSRADVQAALAGDHKTLAIPPPMAIAHHLMKAFAEG